MLALLTLVFVISGAAGLIYESIWSRYLSLLVGHSAYAQIIVLVIFLGGMSLGSLLVGQRSERLRHPLLWYAGIEAAIGFIGLAFNYVYIDISDAAYDFIFPALAGGWTLVVVKWLLAGLMILPQSILLGTTFPLISAGAIRLLRERAGRVLGLLYFANSFGAAIGVLVAGFVLLARVGLPGTLITAAILNFIAAGAVGAGARVVASRPVDDAAEATPILPDGSAGTPTPVALLLGVSFGTAVASFIYEIAWIRMLSLVLGSATHSFELMLSAFILGLALGAFWIRGRADRTPDPLSLLGLVQCVMGLLAIATLPLYVASFSWVATLLDTFKQSNAGYRGFLVARYAICLLVMLPATFCAGITLPLITKLLMDGGGRVRGERAIGAVYGLNTLGSIGGVLIAGLILMPLLGLKLLLIAGALVDIALGLALLLVVARAGEGDMTRPSTRLRPPPTSRLMAATVLIAAFVALIVIVVDFDPMRLTSGVYRYAVLPKKGDYTVPFYRDGRTATVSIRRMQSGFITLSTNGKPDASMDAYWKNPASSGPPHPLAEDIATQVLLPIVTLAHRPDAREVAVIGQGSGMTSHLLLGSPAVRHLSTIEIEPEMINASRFFLPANRRDFEDSRAHFVLDDAKSYFAASGRRFDLILSEPSNPWVSGVSGLFTTEFYRRVRTHLADGGVFGQWLHLYELNDSLATMVLAALDQNFPSYEIFFTSNSDILIVASNEHTLPTPDWHVVDFPGIADDLHRAIPLTPEALEATRLAGRQLLHPYLATQVAPNSDYYPALDLGAERTRYLKDNADGVSGLGESRFDIAAALSGHTRAFGTTSLSVLPEITHVDELARGARLRLLVAAGRLADTSVRREDDDAKDRVRLDALGRQLTASAPPADWRVWVENMRESERLIHGGTAGVADESFYAGLRGYTARVNAPPAARAAIDFLHGLATWNYAEASRAGQILIDARLRDTVDWLPISLVRNGIVVARIQLGDFDGARAAFKAYSRNADEDPFTARVLEAYLRDQERSRKAAIE